MTRNAFAPTRKSFTKNMTAQTTPENAPAGTEIFFSQNERNGKTSFQATCFTGKRNSPDIHNLYGTEARREAHVGNWLAGLVAREEAKAERSAARKNAVCAFKVGDILTGSWGYDQTNVEIFQIVAIKGRRVTIQEMTHEVVEGSEGFMCNSVVPGKTYGEKITKTATTVDGENFYVKLNESCNLHKWSGSKMGKSWYA